MTAPSMPPGPSDRQPKRALGRGLSALIPQASVALQGDIPSSTGIVRLPIESILRDPAQPRKTFDDAKLRELAESIRTQGVIQAVLVRRDGSDYRLIAGERRWRAAQLAGLHEVPAVVRDVTPAEAFELALVENLQRTDLNPLEGIWSSLKRGPLANLAYSASDQLIQVLQHGIRAIQRRPRLIEGCLAETGLTLEAT